MIRSNETYGIALTHQREAHLWAYRPVVDTNVINQAREETAGFKVLSSRGKSTLRAPLYRRSIAPLAASKPKVFATILQSIFEIKTGATQVNPCG